MTRVFHYENIITGFNVIYFYVVVYKTQQNETY